MAIRSQFQNAQEAHARKPRETRRTSLACVGYIDSLIVSLNAWK